MKVHKTLFALILIVALLAIMPSGVSLAGDNAGAVAVFLNEEMLAFSSTDGYGVPYVDGNGRTQVPVRKVLESLGAGLLYDSEAQIVNVRKDGISVDIPIGERYILINGEKTETDTEAVIIQGRTYMPIRAVAEALGYRVYWRSVKKAVYIFDAEEIAGFSIRDPDGYFSLKLEMIRDFDSYDPGSKYLSGFILVEKDMDGKKVLFEEVDENGNVTITKSLFIENELFNGLKAGEIRAVTSYPHSYPDGDAYQVMAADRRSVLVFEFVPIGYWYATPGFFFGGIDDERSQSMSRLNGLRFFLSLNNLEDFSLQFKPVEVDFQIVKVTDSVDELVVSHKAYFPGITLQSLYLYMYDLPNWDFRDKNGELVTPGRYAQQIVLPKYYEYSAEGSEEYIREEPRTNAYRFEFTISD